MGGYAVYVWSAVGLTAVVLIGNAWWAQYKLKQTKRWLTDWVVRGKR
ncbi:MAG: heme exporter protein CcmD [Legionellales bacterium]|nr:heme exporter protein CcmD [Legionellales bacterium]